MENSTPLAGWSFWALGIEHGEEISDVLYPKRRAKQPRPPNLGMDPVAFNEGEECDRHSLSQVLIYTRIAKLKHLFIA